MNRFLLAVLMSGLAGATVAVAQTGTGTPPAPPPPPLQGDPHGDRAVSRADFLAEAARHFDAMDTNKDGVLSRDERRAWHDAHRRFGPGGPGGPGGPRADGPPPPPGDAPPPPPPGQGFGGAGFGGPLGMLQRLDLDGDGKVTRAEYEAPFALLDTNKDGVIDQTELAAAPQGPGGGGRLRRLDRDGDGKVSRAEYAMIFDRLDTNKDGVVDASEVAALRARFGGGRFGGRRFGRGGLDQPQGE